jgi:TrmH family RNA methyltransferase
MLSKKIVKYIQSLSHKKLRDEEHCFIAEGPKVVSEILLSGLVNCKMLCATEAWLRENENSFRIGEDSLQKISLLKTPNKVLAVFEKRLQNLLPFIDNNVSVMLDEIQDPGNLGTIIRIADWFNIETIICSNNCVDCYNPKVVQATMGSLTRVNIFYLDLVSFIQKNKNKKIYAATLSGSSVLDHPKIKEGIILIGNESKGIHEDLLVLATNKITIPRFGYAESLNAAVATGIILSHLKHF